jgi:hypothetical protein
MYRRMQQMLNISVAVFIVKGTCGSIVDRALRYKLEGRRFEPQLSELFLSVYLLLPATLDPAVYSAPNRNE